MNLLKNLKRYRTSKNCEHLASGGTKSSAISQGKRQAERELQLDEDSQEE